MRPTIVVLDGHTLCPTPPGEPAPAGEPTWDALSKLGDVKYYPRTPPSQIVCRCRDATVVVTNKAVLDADAISRLPGVKYIGVSATGTNIVDLAAAKRAGIVVTNAPDYGAASVAQHTLALLLELCSRVGQNAAAVRDGRWVRSLDFSFTLTPTTELAGLTLGIVGAGAIGSAVARIGHAFGMKVAVHSRTRKDLGIPVQWCELDDIFRGDVLTLHCPLTERMRHIVNAQRLATMKRTALLINTSRGALIDELALARALAEGWIAGAALDVLSVEPPTPEVMSLFANVPNCLITPHNAWMTQASRRRLMGIVVANLRAFIEGKPVNVVNP